MLLCALKGAAQYDPSFSHYWAMETSFNPAAAGKEKVVNFVGAYAMTMVGFENAPKTMYAAADMPFFALGTYHGVGAMFMNDQIGVFSHKRFALQYALKRPLLGGVLSKNWGYGAAFWSAWIVNLLGFLGYWIYVKGHFLKERLR